MTACWGRLTQPEKKEEEGERGRQRVHGRSVPEGPPRFKECEPGYRRSPDLAEVPEAQASSEGVDTPISEIRPRPSFRT